MDVLPLYQSHKMVRAARITGVDVASNTLTVETPSGSCYAVGPQLGFFRRSVPSVGDYFVVYRDGYQSHCPASEFFEGYKLAGQPDGQMDFGGALNALRAGKRVARSGWNGKGMWLLLIPESHWETTRLLEILDGLPWIGMKTADNKFVPWLASQTDMLATDWVVVEA